EQLGTDVVGVLLTADVLHAPLLQKTSPVVDAFFDVSARDGVGLGSRRARTALAISAASASPTASTGTLL
ncbi:MAG: hypothetical protein ACRDTT_33525, partial [Pseudonocardiaceae bacterium]